MMLCKQYRKSIWRHLFTELFKRYFCFLSEQIQLLINDQWCINNIRYLCWLLSLHNTLLISLLNSFLNIKLRYATIVIPNMTRQTRSFRLLTISEGIAAKDNNKSIWWIEMRKWFWENIRLHYCHTRLSQTCTVCIAAIFLITLLQLW